MLCCAQSIRCIWLFVTQWPAACQDPLSVGFSSQEYWSEFPWWLVKTSLPLDGSPLTGGNELRSSQSQHNAAPCPWHSGCANPSSLSECGESVVVGWHRRRLLTPPLWPSVSSLDAWFRFPHLFNENNTSVFSKYCLVMIKSTASAANYWDSNPTASVTIDLGKFS